MIRNTLSRFMYGRYGNDPLNMFLIVSYLTTYILFSLTDLYLLHFLSVGLIIFSLFRLLSRNLQSRRRENAKFMKHISPVIRWYKLKQTIRSDKEHRYFKCSQCGQQLRVPRGKGKITVTCRGCGNSFQENS